MVFKIKELFLTLQGEGFNAGKRAVFVRFTGCNFWSGRELDRDTATCSFCDTDFVGTDGLNGGEYSATELVKKIEDVWGVDHSDKFVVFTGGEPTLQITSELVNDLKQCNYFTAIETNGSNPIVADVDWVTVSPKTANVKVTSGNELKLVYPQQTISPDVFANYSFNHFYLQPKDNDHFYDNAKITVQYCLNHPQWRLSIQTHKVVGIM
tara:strand:+ start:191 stop:817 length:627 start_codon:yes stop_codon:yes gene_type:complete